MIVWSEKKTSDILLKKRGSLASEAATAPATPVGQASHVALSSSVQRNPDPVSSEDVISKQLADLGWAPADIRTTICLLKQRGQKITLENCRDYLEKMFRPAPARKPSTNPWQEFKDDEGRIGIMFDLKDVPELGSSLVVKSVIRS